MNDKPSCKFDISDPDGIRLLLLRTMFERKNGFALWTAFKLCRDSAIEPPSWVMDGLDDTASYIIGNYTGVAADLIKELHLTEPQKSRLLAVGEETPAERQSARQKISRAMLPIIVDQYAEEHGMKAQTAIKKLAPRLGFPGEQWTKLRDAYNASKAKASGE